MRYADWLRRADPDQRHVAALSWNWDYGLAPLLWIIRREDCDKATALHVFLALARKVISSLEATGRPLRRSILT